MGGGKVVNQMPTHDLRQWMGREYSIPKMEAVYAVAELAGVSLRESKERIERLKFVNGEGRGWPVLYRPCDLSRIVHKLRGDDVRKKYAKKEIRAYERKPAADKKPEELPKAYDPAPETKFEQRTTKPKRDVGAALASLDERTRREIERTKEEALRRERGTAYPFLDIVQSVLATSYGIKLSKEGLKNVCNDYDLFVPTTIGQRLMDTTLELAARIGIFDGYDVHGNPKRGYDRKHSLEMQAAEEPVPVVVEEEKSPIRYNRKTRRANGIINNGFSHLDILGRDEAIKFASNLISRKDVGLVSLEELEEIIDKSHSEEREGCMRGTVGVMACNHAGKMLARQARKEVTQEVGESPDNGLTYEERLEMLNSILQQEEEEKIEPDKVSLTLVSPSNN